MSLGDTVAANGDGSHTIWFGPRAVPGHESNWIQTVSGKRWFPLLRLYGPRDRGSTRRGSRPRSSLCSEHKLTLVPKHSSGSTPACEHFGGGVSRMSMAAFRTVEGPHLVAKIGQRRWLSGCKGGGWRTTLGQARSAPSSLPVPQDAVRARSRSKSCHRDGSVPPGWGTTGSRPGEALWRLEHRTCLVVVEGEDRTSRRGYRPAGRAGTSWRRRTPCRRHRRMCRRTANRRPSTACTWPVYRRWPRRKTRRGRGVSVRPSPGRAVPRRPWSLGVRSSRSHRRTKGCSTRTRSRSKKNPPWTRTHHDAPFSGIRHNDRLVQNCSQPFVGRERLILHNADGGEVTGDLGIEGLGRFELDQLIEHGEEVTSEGGTVLISLPLPSTNVTGWDWLSGPSGAWPVRKDPMLVP